MVERMRPCLYDKSFNYSEKIRSERRKPDNYFCLTTDSALPRNWINLGCEEVIRMYEKFSIFNPFPTTFACFY